MLKLSALGCLILTLTLTLGACANDPGSSPSAANGAVGSEVAKPTARQAGVIGH